MKNLLISIVEVNGVNNTPSGYNVSLQVPNAIPVMLHASSLEDVVTIVKNPSIYFD